MNHQRKILVTGGAGFIGSHTITALVSAGFTPIIADDFRNADASVPSRIEKIIGHLPEFLKIDVCDKEALKQAANESNRGEFLIIEDQVCLPLLLGGI